MTQQLIGGKFSATYPDGVSGGLKPAVGYLLHTYVSGTTTPLATWSDVGLSALNTNPVVMDARGEASIFIGSAVYTLVLKSPLGATIWTRDGISSSDAISASLAASTGSGLIGWIQAGIGAVLRWVQDKLRESVSVKDFGAVGDGVTDDTAAFQAFLDVAGDLYVNPGTYRLTGKGVIGSANTHLRLAAGAVIDYSGCTTFGAPNSPFSNRVYGLSFHGSIGSNVSLTADASSFQNLVTVASVSGLSADDWIYISSQSYYETDTNTKYGEFAQIASVGGLTLTLYGDLYLSYNVANSAIIRKMSFAENIKISGNGKFLGPASPTGISQAAVLFQYCRNIRVDDVKSDLSYYVAFQTYKSLDGIFNGVTPMRDGSPGGNIGFSHVYGSSNMHHVNCTSYDLCHTVDASGDTASGGVCMNITAKNCYVYGAKGSAFNTHPGVGGVIDYSHNVVYMANGLTAATPTGMCAIRCQGPEFVAIGNRCYNVTGQAIFHQYETVADVHRETTMMGNVSYASDSNTVDYPGNIAYLVQGYTATGDVYSVTMQGNKAYGFTCSYYVYANLMNIANVNMIGNDGDCGSATSNYGAIIRAAAGKIVSKGSVTNNTLRVSGGSQNLYLLGADVDSIKYMTVGGNVLTGASTYGLRIDHCTVLNLQPNIIPDSPNPIRFDSAATNSNLNLGSNTARKTANNSITSNIVLADETELLFPVGVQAEWCATFSLDFGAALATTGLQLAVTAPAGSTINVIASVAPDVFTGAKTYTRRTTTSGATLNFTASDLASVGDAKVEIYVWVDTGATAGNVKMQLAQSTSSGTALVLRKGSYMTANQLA